MTEITINPVGNGSRQTASQIRTETEATPGAAITGRFAAQAGPAGPSPDTSLDIQQINVQIASKPAPEAWIHSGVRRQRSAVKAALWSMPGHGGRATRYENCGGNAWVIRKTDSPGTCKVECNQCGDRMCPTCSRLRQQTIRTQLAAAVEGKTVSMITLTLKHRQEKLCDTIKRLTDGFRELRRTVLWKNCVSGGAGVMEIKRNHKTRMWHVHYHLIAEHKFIPQWQLSMAWMTATGDSQIVDIRRIKDARTGVNYVTKYLTKGIEMSTYDDQEELQDYIGGIHGTRMITTFGSWRGIKLSQAEADPLEEPFDRSQWEQVDTLDNITARALAGSKEDIDILNACGLQRILRDPDG